MTKLKASEIRKMNKEEKNKRLKELRLGLIKARGEASKGGSSKIRDTKKTIARILTLNTSKRKLKNSK